ncbi:hypothetical protein ACIQ4I_01300 [Rummeliibacillus sp. NPDC094406]|uniref:hypothetical protein n=1 Tax=Rummeliibacillus sp. NPDC094406 TaxID=3364511 RepID=UPI003802F01B
MYLLLIFFTSVLFFILTFIVSTLGTKFLCLLISILLYKWGSYQIKLIEMRREEAIKKETEEMLQEYPHSHSTVSSDYLNALLIGEASQTFFVAKREDTDSDFEVREYLFNEIYETAIEEDGNQIALISRGGLLGGSLIDGGGNSLVYVMEPENSLKDNSDEESEETTEKSSEEVSKLSLKVVVDDLSNPIIEYVFLEPEEPVEKDSDVYKEASKQCKKWHQMISVLIKRHDNLNKVVIKRYENSNRVV